MNVPLRLGKCFALVYKERPKKAQNLKGVFSGAW